MSQTGSTSFTLQSYKTHYWKSHLSFHLMQIIHIKPRYSQAFLFWESENDGMSNVRKSFGKHFILSTEVLDLIMTSWLESTSKQYAPNLRRCFIFCSENGLEPLNADVTSAEVFWISVSENVLVSILQLTQLVQFCHLFYQQSMDLILVSSL